MAPFYDIVFFILSFLPLLFIDILQLIFWRFLSYMVDIFSKLLLLIMMEVLVRIVLVIPTLCHSPTLPQEESETSPSSNKCVQTSGPWQKRIRSQERHYTELKEKLEVKTKVIKCKRMNLLRKGKDRLTKFKTDIDGKSKMLTGVKIQLLHMGNEVQSLINRIRENRQILEIKRADNKQIVERYEEINIWLNNNFQTSLPDAAATLQQPAPGLAQ